MYWVTYKLPQICTEILRIRIGKVARFAVYIYGNFWGTLYKKANEFDKKKHFFSKRKTLFFNNRVFLHFALTFCSW